MDNIRPAFIPKYFAPSSHTNSQAFQYLTPEVRISFVRGILSIFTLLFIFTLQPKWIDHYAPYFSLQVVASLLSRTCHVEHSRLLASAHAATCRCLPATLRTAARSSLGSCRHLPPSAPPPTLALAATCSHPPATLHAAVHPTLGPGHRLPRSAPLRAPTRLTRRATRGRR